MSDVHAYRFFRIFDFQAKIYVFENKWSDISILEFLRDGLLVALLHFLQVVYSKNILGIVNDLVMISAHQNRVFVCFPIWKIFEIASSIGLLTTYMTLFTNV